MLKCMVLLVGKAEDELMKCLNLVSIFILIEFHVIYMYFM